MEPRRRQERLLGCTSGGLYMLSEITVAHIQPIVALIAGILILIIPQLLNIIVAVYLILIGVIGLGLLH
jgi:hypothetical protein